MIPFPYSVFLFEDLQDVIPAFGPPTADIFVCNVGRKISQAATAAAPAFYGLLIITHVSLPYITSCPARPLPRWHGCILLHFVPGIQ